eukprot:TRINITY_DN377_c0_g1_i2.p1 TRINITY_DN377_c0_g1~~TRINITY_DN377_c0_g1_i2.p1  ORF type:complete len:2003 (+),score=627.31 TRINITY_DN377_c0_g1_i2:115-6123(+)
MQEDDGVYEVEDLLEHKNVDGKHYYLVKWKGFGETSWEPDENIGNELSELKRAAREGRGGQAGKKRDREGKKKKDKKEKKRRKRDSSEDGKKKRGDGSDSDSSKDEQMFPGMPPNMMPGMFPPGMMSPEAMMAKGADPAMMGKGMPPGMMMGKGCDPMMMGKGCDPMMMKAGCKGMPPPGMGMPPGKGMPPPGFPFDPAMMGKGMPPGMPPPGMLKGKAGGKPGLGFGPISPMQSNPSLDMQRFAVEHKRGMREFSGALHVAHGKGAGKSDHPAFLTEKQCEHTRELHTALGLQLEDNMLPVMSPSEVVIADALWLLWLHDPEKADADVDRELFLDMAKFARVNQSRTRLMLIRAFRKIWPSAGFSPSTRSVELFKVITELIPPAPGPRHPPGSPEYWKELVTKIYEQHNADKLKDVDNLLIKYKGREQTLYLGICEKYKVPPTFGMPTGMPPGWPGGKGGPAALQDKHTDPKVIAKVKELICEVYKEHNPEKLGGIDALLAKYKGREEQVYKGICTKYKVEPKPVKLDTANDKPEGGDDKAEKAQKGEKKSKAKDGESAVEKYKQLISEIYAEHNKEKLGEIDDILQKYQGKEKTLYLAVCKKYSIEPKNLKAEKAKKKTGDTAKTGDAAAAVPAAAPAPLDPEAAAKEHAEKVAVVKPLIIEIYQHHNPAKLDHVDDLLTKYKGREEQLYHSVCEKYKVPPKIPKPGAPMPPGMLPLGQVPPHMLIQASGPPGRGVPVLPPGQAAPGMPPLPGQGGPPPPEMPMAMRVRMAYSELIQEVYKAHNPEKLEQVDRLLDKYLGQEQDLYMTICKKYNVTPKDPLGLGDLEWLSKAEDRLPQILERLVTAMVFHAAGLQSSDVKRLADWEKVRPQPPPRRLSLRYELGELASPQADKIARKMHGDDGQVWLKLREKCEKVELKGPSDVGGEAHVFAMASNSSGPTGRKPFDLAHVQLSEAIGRAVKESLEEEDETARHEKWVLPFSMEETSFLVTANGDQEVAVEYKRGCWQLRRQEPLRPHASHHSLVGPDVENRLPNIWREMADKLWGALCRLRWGVDMPMDAVVTVEVTCGRKAQRPSPGMPLGCSSSGPGAWVVVTSVSEEDLGKARSVVAPILQKILSELRVNGLFAQSSLYMPQHRPAGLTRVIEHGDSSSESEAEGDMDDVLSDAEPTESYRPMRLTRAKIRDAYLQGMLCLNCDAGDHKHTDCPFRRRVCWNCHGWTCAGVQNPDKCPMRCRFTGQRTAEYPLLESVKRSCRRLNDWKKSKPAQEQRTVLSTFEHLMIKLEGFEDLSLAKNNMEVQSLVKSLNEHATILPGETAELARAIMNMQPLHKKAVELPVPPPPPGPPPKPYVAPKMPKDAAPTMPENKYPWCEKIFLDELLAKGMYGSNVLSRVIGRGGAHHRRMESESGARVFFRGLGVSGRDAELNDSSDCRLHILVKGDVPAQGQTVRRILKEIIAALDTEIAEQAIAGPLLDKPRDVEAHPFGFLLAKGAITTEHDEPLKFKFPEEDGQSLNDLLVWLKQAKLPLELDSDTQWRTSLQVTPADPAPPDDAPAQAEAVVEAFNKLLAEWHFPCPYWFEEQDLKPTGLWTSLVADDDVDMDESSAVSLQQGQGVRLSASAAAHFASVLQQCGLVDVSHAIVVDVLARLRGSIRRHAEDEQLLLFLSYPWAFFAEAMGRGLKLPFNKEQTQEMLVDLGRVGGRPTDSCGSPAFRGFIVEWMPLKGGPPRPAAEKALADIGMPLAPTPAQPSAAPVAAVPQPAAVPAAAPPRGVCKYWLPEAIFASTQNLNELLAGPGGSHFGHLMKKYPSVLLTIEGQSSTAAPPAHRLHVQMSSEDSEIFESAAADVLDLVETVCDMVGDEFNMDEDQVEALIREVRAEKYFEAHGIRTPLAPTRPAAPPPPQAAAAPEQPRQPSWLAGYDPAAVAAAAAAPQAAAAKLDDDFEFVDEDDLDMAAGGADGDATEDDDDDARTEASDELSEISEEGAPGQQQQFVFDDI